MALADTEHVLDYTELKRLIDSKNQHNKKNQHATHTHSSNINSTSTSSSIVLDAKGGSKSQSTIPHSASGSLHHHNQSSYNNNNPYTTVAPTASTTGAAYMKHTTTNKLLLPSTKSTKRYPISTTHRPNANLTSSLSHSILHKSTPSRHDPLPRLGSSLDYQNSSILLDDEGSVDTYTGHNYDHSHNNLYTNSTTSISYKNDNNNGSMVNDTPLLRKMARVKGVEAMATYSTYYTLYNNNNNNITNITTTNNINSSISLEDSMDMKGHNYDQVINMLEMNSHTSDPQSDDDDDKNTTANYTSNNKHSNTNNSSSYYKNSSMSNSSLLMSKSLQRLIDARNLYY